MRVQVDKARCNDTTRGVQNAVGGLPLQTADLGDFAVFDPDVADIPSTYAGVKSTRAMATPLSPATA